MAPPGSQDRLLGANLRHYRRRYDVKEARAGAVLLLGLAAVAAWVAWRGAHPDPALFTPAPSLARRAPEAPVDRGPLPRDVAPAGFAEGRGAVYDATNLYVKVDGREGYYKAFGFQRLYFLPLTQGERTLDLELYDLGTPANALGACSGELPQGKPAEFRDGTLWLVDRNALFLARGRHYLKAVGSAEDEGMRAALEALRRTLVAALPAEALPPTHALFAAVGVAPAQVSFLTEAAFSFEFAKGVHLGLLPDGETEVFVMPAPDAAAARGLVDRFVQGFLGYGERAGQAGGATWVKDRYQGRVSGAVAVGPLVAGVHGAAGVAEGARALEQLVAAVKALPPGTSLAAGPARQEGARE